MICILNMMPTWKKSQNIYCISYRSLFTIFKWSIHYKYKNHRSIIDHSLQYLHVTNNTVFETEANSLDLNFKKYQRYDSIMKIVEIPVRYGSYFWSFTSQIWCHHEKKAKSDIVYLIVLCLLYLNDRFTTNTKITGP